MAAGDHTVTGTMTANKVAVTDTVVVTNLNADQVDGADKDTDVALAANSDAKVPSQKAVKAYIDAADALKADDDAVVHDTGAETVADVKTFSSAPVFSAGAQLGDAGVALKTKVLTMGFDGAAFAETAHGLTPANIRGVCAFPPVANGALVIRVGFDDDGTTKIRVELNFAYAGSGYAIVFYV